MVAEEVFMAFLTFIDEVAWNKLSSSEKHSAILRIKHVLCFQQFPFWGPAGKRMILILLVSLFLTQKWSFVKKNSNYDFVVFEHEGT